MTPCLTWLRADSQPYANSHQTPETSGPVLLWRKILLTCAHQGWRGSTDQQDLAFGGFREDIGIGTLAVVPKTPGLE